MNKKPNCIICGEIGRKITRNSLPMLICDNCNLFWRDSFDLGDDYYETRGFELENNKKLDARYANSTERIELLKKYANLNNLCDIGCGEGIFLKALTDLGYKNIIGLEPSTEVHRFAKLNNLKIIEGGIENQNKSFFEDNDIHTITMFHVIEHLGTPEIILRSIHNNLKRGDKLIIETPDTNSVIFTKNNYENEFVYPEHLYYYNKNNLQQLLRNSGFTVVAFGNRDFNEKSMSIRNSLARLGVIKFSKEEKNHRIFPEKTEPKNSSNHDDMIKRAMRNLLSRAVSFLSRGNYLWIVAEKI